MSELGVSPSSSPPAPPADFVPPPDDSSLNSAPPPADSSSPPTPPSDSSPPPPSEPSPPPPPPPDALLPPVPSILPPSKGSPPPSPPNSPPANSKNSPPPPTSTKSPSPPPPVDLETPPGPSNPSDTSPPSRDPQSPPVPSSSPNVGRTHPQNPSSDSPPAPPLEPTNSPPAPPFDRTNPTPIQPSGPPDSPPANQFAPPSLFNPPTTKPSAGPIGSPSLTVPSKATPSPSGGTNGGGGGYQGKTVVGMGVAGVAIIALIAIVFLVRRKKKRNLDIYARSHYLPHQNFSVKSDGFLYGQNPSKGYSGGQVSTMYNSQQLSSMGNSHGTQLGHHHQSAATPDAAILGSGQTHFSYEELADITQGFSSQNILGEGGFGCVYKGTLQDGRVVAVKQLKAGSGQGDREFKAEVEIISRVHHCHLVSLVGYCISDPHRLLIYEYVSNQTLEHHLHGKGVPVLEWSKRLRIAIGSAKGLAYLHEDCYPKIIHRDIKSANILLDDEYEAQVADFGLARLNDTTQTHVSTRVMGTFGYLAPEYASSGKLTDRSDVFSFGVVLLELVTGRKPVDQNQPLGEESLVEWARPHLLNAIETGDCSELIDKRLEKHYVEHEVFRMIETAAACVRHSGPKRPRMVQVVRALDCDGDSGDISNGIKVGQSTTYDSGQYNEDIMKFRKMAFGLDDTSESGMYSGDYSVKSSSEFSGNESETRPFNNRRF